MQLTEQNILSNVNRIIAEDGSIEDLLFICLEYLAIVERSATLNPSSTNRITRTQQDTNNVNYAVSLEVQPAFDDATGLGVTYEVADYLPNMPVSVPSGE